MTMTHELPVTYLASDGPVTYLELDAALGELIAEGINWPRCGLARTGPPPAAYRIAFTRFQFLYDQWITQPSYERTRTP